MSFFFVRVYFRKRLKYNTVLLTRVFTPGLALRTLNIPLLNRNLEKLLHRFRKVRCFLLLKPYVVDLLQTFILEFQVTAPAGIPISTTRPGKTVSMQRSRRLMTKLNSKTGIKGILVLARGKSSGPRGI